MIGRKELLMKHRLAVTLTVAAAALLIGAGTAQAKDNTGHDHDTQSPTQGVSAGQATLDQAGRSFGSENGDNRPDGARGTESQLMKPDSRYLEGPLGGLVHNGPKVLTP
jgi:hypothetical protein